MLFIITICEIQKLFIYKKVNKSSIWALDTIYNGVWDEKWKQPIISSNAFCKYHNFLPPQKKKHQFSFIIPQPLEIGNYIKLQ